MGIAAGLLNKVWPLDMKVQCTITHKHLKTLSECVSNVCLFFFFPSGPESRERPGVLRAHRKAPDTAPSACEQSYKPCPPSIFSLFLPSTLPKNTFPFPFPISCPFLPPLPSFSLTLSPLLSQEGGKKKTLPRQTEDRIGVHHGSSDRQTAG